MAEITEISVQKKDAGRVNLYLDGRFFCGMELGTVVAHGLKPGMHIDVLSLSRIQFESEKETALARALRYITSTFKTERQMRDYLKGKGYTQEVEEYVITSLIGYRYIDDRGYADLYIADNKAVKGKKLLKYELMQKGIAAGVISEALESLDGEAEACKTVATKYLRGKRIDNKFHAKLCNYLYSKGFDFDTVKAVAKELLSPEED